MLAGRHLPTLIQVVNYEQDLNKHHKKLVEIHKGEGKKKIIEKEDPAKGRLGEVREKSIKFHNTEKAVQIEKDNELLLGKLVEISRKKKNNLFPIVNENLHNKSLNAPSRKREKDRIAMENEAFARRLLSQQPCFNRKRLDNDYEKHAERVKLMQRLVAISPKTLRLPPLKYDDFEKDRKTQSGKEKRTVNLNKNKKKKVKRNKLREDEKEDIAEEEEEDRREEEEDERSTREEKIKKEKEDAQIRVRETPEQDEKQEKAEEEGASRQSPTIANNN